VALAGCGRTAGVVKENLDFKPMVCNAFSRAIAFGTGKKIACPPKATSFPDLPRDESDPRVRKFVSEYAYQQRETMKTYLARAREYLPMVKTVAKEKGLPEDVAYLFVLESGANPEARSPANALGMWQFMPSTARSYGLRVDSWIDERLDPWKSTKAAMLYLKDLYGMFGCWRLAMSAYNSGENKLNKVLCQEDASEYSEICSSRRLKKETREFFPRFQAIAAIARNPGKYGFAKLDGGAPDDRHELVTVDGSYSLEALARGMDVPYDRLAELNPALVRGATPAEGPPYSLRIPLGKKEVLVAKLRELPEVTVKKSTVHVVGKGDNLAKIAKRYQVRKAQLAELNPDVNFHRRLRQGSRILVPVSKIQTKKTTKRDRFSWLDQKARN